MTWLAVDPVLANLGLSEDSSDEDITSKVAAYYAKLQSIEEALGSYAFYQFLEPTAAVADECASLCQDVITALAAKSNFQQSSNIYRDYIHPLEDFKNQASKSFRDQDFIIRRQSWTRDNNVRTQLADVRTQLDNLRSFIGLYDLAISDYKRLVNIDYNASQVTKKYTVYGKSLYAWRDYVLNKQQ